MTSSIYMLFDPTQQSHQLYETEDREHLLPVQQTQNSASQQACEACDTRDAAKHVQDFEAVIRSRSLNSHLPTSLQARQRQRLIPVLNHLQLQSSWTALIPCRLGHSKAVDLAVNAVLQAYLSRIQGTHTRSRAAHESYGKALSVLRETIDVTDQSLVATSLLGFFETLMEADMGSNAAHNKGLEMILLARGPSYDTNYGRAMVYCSWGRKFGAPVALGTASRFDQSEWLELEPPDRPNESAEARKLEKLTHQLMIRLPRLIAGIRRLANRETPQVPVPDYATYKVVSLAEELLDLEDRVAESKLLHLVKVAKTVHGDDRPIVPFSFEYKSVQQLQTATHYWHARLLLIRLYLKVASFLGKAQSRLSFSHENLSRDTKRFITNIMMSWQWTREHGVLARHTFTAPLIVSWGSCMELDQWRGMPIDTLQHWILQRLNYCIAGWSWTISTHDMEDACHLLVGGPLQGFLTKSYTANRQKR